MQTIPVVFLAVVLLEADASVTVVHYLAKISTFSYSVDVNSVK